jgi:hypothetical protein
MSLTQSFPSPNSKANQYQSLLHRLLPVEKFFHPRLHGSIHLDERRPGAFKAFAGKFLGCVNAEFAADGDFAGGVIEYVRWTFGEDAVALRVGVGAEMKQNFAGIMYVYSFVYDNEVFREHHLSHAP